MTPHQLLAREPVRVNNDAALLWGYLYSHVPEVGDPAWLQPRRHRGRLRVDARASYQVAGVEVRTYRDHHFDARRIWRLSSVHVRGLPVLIVRNGGREGDDEASRYVFDVFLYAELVEVLGRLPRDRRTGYPKTRAGWSCSSRPPDHTDWVPCRRADEFFGGRNLDSPPEFWAPY